MQRAAGRAAAWRGAKALSKVRGDGGIVGRGAGEDLGGQLAPQFQGGIAGGRDLLGHHGVIRRVHDHGDALMVFGGAAQHGRAADIDILDGLAEA